MKNKFKIDTSILIVLALVFSILIILLAASLFDGNKIDAPGTTTTPPQLTYPPVSNVPQREEIYVSSEERFLEDKYEKDETELIYSFV